jgi:hypothetical protein
MSVRAAAAEQTATQPIAAPNAAAVAASSCFLFRLTSSQSARAIQQQQLSANDAAAVASHAM